MRPGEWIIDNGETLVSAGGKFEIGFFSPTGSSGDKRYVGIWYHEWDDNRTVVWVANRNFPIINAIGVFNVTEELGLKVLGCVCFGFKSLLEMLFRQCGYLVAHGK